MRGLWDYITSNGDEIISRTIEHFQLALLAIIIAILIGVPLGILISYVKSLKKPILGFSNVMQALPSLALLGFLVPLVGIGTVAAIFMTVVYSLLPIVKNTATGINNIDKGMTEAAKGIGMTQLQVLTKVKLPLAWPVIMAGIRISAVTAVGLVTLASVIGAGGLGFLIYSGIRTVNVNQILAGAIPACIMALCIDFFVSLIEKVITPISLTSKIKTATPATIKRHKIGKAATLITSCALVLTVLLMTIISPFLGGGGSKLVIGSKDYTESTILGHLYAEYIQANSDIEVELKSDLGSNVIFEAVKRADVDFYIDFTGTIYANILNYTEMSTPQAVYDVSKEEMMSRYGLEVLDPLGYNNTYAISVRKETAEEYNLKTCSDLAAVASGLIFGATYEMLNRPDGLPGFKEAYSVRAFKEEKGFEGNIRYEALVRKDIDITDAFSTDGLLLEYNFTVLEDDKNFFPPYEAVPVVRPAALDKFPQLHPLLDKFAYFFNDEVMRNLNYKVDVQKQNPRNVALEFLEEHELI